MFKRHAMLALALTIVGFSNSAIAEDRIISIGGAITEIVYALGEQDRLVGRDTTSTWPAETSDLPDIGYARALSPEGVLSVEPTLIIAEQNTGPQETIEVLQAAKIPYITIQDGFSREGIIKKIRTVAKALNVEEKGETLANEVAVELEAAEKRVDEVTRAKRVLFILSTRGGKIMAAGTNSSADSIINLAGGINVFGGFSGYKQVSDEAVTQANPDVILMMAPHAQRSDHSPDDDKLFAMPALQTTNAAINKQIVRMNGLLMLGFGPRTAQAITELNTALYGANK